MCLCLLVVCIGGLWKAVGWVELGVECGWEVSYVVGGCNVYSFYTEHGRYECRNCRVHKLVCYLIAA